MFLASAGPTERIPVPERHRTIPNLLNAASMTGLPLLIWGLIQLWPTVLGMMLIAGAKLAGTSTGWRSSTTTWSARTRNCATADLTRTREVGSARLRADRISRHRRRRAGLGRDVRAEQIAEDFPVVRSGLRTRSMPFV